MFLFVDLSASKVQNQTNRLWHLWGYDYFLAKGHYACMWACRSDLGLQWAWAGLSNPFLSSSSNRQEAPCFICEHLKAKSYFKRLNTVNQGRIVPKWKGAAEGVYCTRSSGFFIVEQAAALVVFSDYNSAYRYVEVCGQAIYFCISTSWHCGATAGLLLLFELFV